MPRPRPAPGEYARLLVVVRSRRGIISQIRVECGQVECVQRDGDLTFFTAPRRFRRSVRHCSRGSRRLSSASLGKSSIVVYGPNRCSCEKHGEGRQAHTGDTIDPVAAEGVSVPLRFPVLQPQTGYAGELASIMADLNQLATYREDCDQEVVGSESTIRRSAGVDFVSFNRCQSRGREFSIKHLLSIFYSEPRRPAEYEIAVAGGI